MLYTYILIFAALFIVEILYFKIAEHFKIIDKPNHRSSHTIITIRGGGIIFPIAVIFCTAMFGFIYSFFLTGLLLVAIISFLDDIKPLSNKIRLSFHFIAAILLLAQIGILQLPLVYIVVAIFFTLAVINVVNFMDGINGITGIYGFVALATLYYLNLKFYFTDGRYLIVSLLAVVVFDFFNCRKYAKCFAGDVGSVSIAFILTFYLLQLICKTHNLNYILLLLIYGLDSLTTIVFRIIRKEDITAAHRTHFYQYLANNKNYSHLFVAALYGFTQLLINIAVVCNPNFNSYTLVVVIILSTIIFLFLRFTIEGKERLLIGLQR